MKRLALLLTLALTMTVEAKKVIVKVGGYLPSVPRVSVDTTYTTPSGTNIPAANSGAFTSALSSASPGDIITLTAGVTYTGTFTLPNKGGSTYIYIISSGLASLPASGTRIATSDVSNMPLINGPSPTEPAIVCDTTAHHFRFVGIRFGSETGEANNGLVRLGTGSETSTSQFPHHIILDRCIVRGDPTTGGRRGVLLSGNYLAVTECYIYDWKLDGTDTQAVAGWTGNGPWKVSNSFLEAAGENMLVGGSDPLILNLVPSDITVTDNTFSKPLNWNPYHASYDSSTWSVKNHFELKNAKRVKVDGNLFTHHWFGAQSGRAILFTTKNQDGTANWSEVSDITFTNNVIDGSHSGVTVSGNDGGYASAGGSRILIANNFFHDIGGSGWGEGGGNYSQIFALTGGMRYLTIRHNTIIHGTFSDDGLFISADGAAYEDFRFTDNIVEHNTYGVKGPGFGVGNATLDNWFPVAIFLRNVIVAGSSGSYPANNYFPANMAAVGFENIPNDYRLDAASPYIDVATDGGYVGAPNAVIQELP